MTSLLCTIKLQKSIKDLIKNRASFCFLEKKMPIASLATTWDRGDVVSKDLQVIAIGKSGYGKSTTLNALIGEPAFETNDTQGCTRTMQSAEYSFPTCDENFNFSLADLPGIGENPELDKGYIDLYRVAINKSHVVIYFLKADQRDYSIDEWAFSRLFQASEDKRKVILVLNAIDKVEPLSRRRPFVLSAEQQLNIDIKISNICKAFGVAQINTVSISALENINTDVLVNRIRDLLVPYMQSYRSS